MTSLVKVILLELLLVVVVCVSQGQGYGFDSAASCGPGGQKQSRKGRAQMLASIPCDLSTQAYCNQPGSAYPWHAVRRFVHENQGLMKRMYGDVRHISVLRDEMLNNDIDISDMELAAERYSYETFISRGSKQMLYKYDHSDHSKVNQFSPKEPHFRPITTTSTISTESLSVTDSSQSNEETSAAKSASNASIKDEKLTTNIYNKDKLISNSISKSNTDIISESGTLTTEAIQEKDDKDKVELNEDIIEQHAAANIETNSVYETSDEEARVNKPIFVALNNKEQISDEIYSNYTDQPDSRSNNATTESTTTTAANFTTTSTSTLRPTSTVTSINASSNGGKGHVKQRRPFVPSPVYRQRPNPFNFYRQNATISAKLKLKLNPSEATSKFPVKDQYLNNNTATFTLKTAQSTNLPSLPASLTATSTKDAESVSSPLPISTKVSTPFKFNKNYNRPSGNLYNQMHRISSNSGSSPIMANTSVVSHSNFMLLGEKPPNSKSRSTTVRTPELTGTSTQATISQPTKSSSSTVTSTTSTPDSQLFQDSVREQEPPQLLNIRGVNACPVKEEVVAPFWANNTRGEVLALLNLYPFEQYVHWEKCTHEHKQMHCKEGCRCEQQYRLHRLLAYDPHNECRGIFSDWFRFPSCCVCKCYNIPYDFRTTSRSPRSQGGDSVNAHRHPIEIAEEQVKHAIYAHATDEWYRPKDEFTDFFEN